MARVSAAKREPQPIDPLTTEVIEYKSAKDEETKLTKRIKKLRDSLMLTLEKAGFTDENGHQWIELDPEITGLEAIQRQRRTSRGIDMEAAEETLKRKNLWESCTQQVRVLDEDAVYRALQEEKLSEEDIDTIFPQSTTYALVLKK